jgi:hypothetical protein
MLTSPSNLSRFPLQLAVNSAVTSARRATENGMMEKMDAVLVEDILNDELMSTVEWKFHSGC